MNQDFILAFVAMPIVVVAMACVALLLNDWELRRCQNNTPAG